MTNSEAIKMLKSKMDGSVDTSYEWCECIRMAIKALEQEPCDDAISRQEVLNNAYAYGNGLEPDGYCVNVEDIQALPPVTPQPRSEVLDKIRAEIEAKCCITVGRENDGAITLHDVFEILDKYKTESEDKE